MCESGNLYEFDDCVVMKKLGKPLHALGFFSILLGSIWIERSIEKKIKWHKLSGDMEEIFIWV